MKEFEYDVALSFANENRDYVEQVAFELQSHGVKVFYDRYEEASLWGKNLYDYLSLIYGKKSNYCIIFISKHYSKKQWTNLERESAMARAFIENKEYILPVRFDDTELPGLKSTIAYKDATIHTPSDIATLVLRKLNKKVYTLPETCVLRFDTDSKIDFEYLMKSLENYKSWNTVNVTSKLPITIILPFNLQQRIDSYRNILESIVPSIEISEEIIKQAKYIYSEKYIEDKFVSEIKYSIRTVYSLYLNEIITLSESKEIIEIYVTSKLVNYIRNILAYRIIGTEDEDWLAEYYNLPGYYSLNLMSGLPYIIRQKENKQFLFWVDFDLYDKRTFVFPLDHIRHYLYLPDNLILKLNQDYKQLREDLIKYVVPQLIQFKIDRLSDFSISDFIKNPDNYSISLRKENFYRIDTNENATNSVKKLENDFRDLINKLDDEKLSLELMKKIILSNVIK